MSSFLIFWAVTSLPVAYLHLRKTANIRSSVLPLLIICLPFLGPIAYFINFHAPTSHQPEQMAQGNFNYTRSDFQWRWKRMPRKGELSDEQFKIAVREANKQMLLLLLGLVAITAIAFALFQIL